MIKNLPLNANKIRNGIAEIESGTKELSALVAPSVVDFKADKRNYALAEHYFRRVLEEILTIGTHILSRLPVKTKDYQEIIVALGEQGIISKDFAERNKRLAVYRNRLVHVYWEVSADELYEIIKKHISDIEEFCRYYRLVLQKPEKFGLSVD